MDNTISSNFFEIAAIFVGVGAFYFLGYLLGYQHGLKEGIEITLNTCKSMSDVIVQLAFGGNDNDENQNDNQCNQ